ncbi:MAG: hypothetical protein A3I43_03485 [Omnitrophica WOR_2 bacterium RIFCSPLOWO2_02_FULL_50_19]|nr:MAG: hypothetical protein A3I43_03485 [Omnitrophica WOR_2 bacterium RIFCSPLOWO2_02_FULL_50_19]
MIKVIIFDFDGVIVESVDIKTKAFAELFKKEGGDAVKKIVDYHLANTGVSRYEKFRYIYRQILKRDLSDGEFKGLCDRFADLVMQSVVEAPYVKGAEAFLKEHATKYKLFVVSATPQKEIEEIIRKRNIAHFFSAIYGAPTKKTDAVKGILENGDPESAVYIGDAISDYNAAKDNRIDFIARIDKDKGIFSDIDCLKIRNLTYLEKAIEELGSSY